MSSENKLKPFYDSTVFCCTLRRMSESLKLIGSAMFDATFVLVTRVGLP